MGYCRLGGVQFTHKTLLQGGIRLHYSFFHHRSRKFQSCGALEKSRGGGMREHTHASSLDKVRPDRLCGDD